MIMGGHRYKGSLVTDQWPWCGKCAQNFLQVIFQPSGSTVIALQQQKTGSLYPHSSLTWISFVFSGSI